MALLKLKWPSRAVPLAGCPTLTDPGGSTVPPIVGGTIDGEVVALDDQGREIWTVPIGSRVSAWPTVDEVPGRGKVVLAASEDGVLACLSLHGDVLWRTELESPATSFNSVGVVRGSGETRIVVTDRLGRVTGVSTDGEMLWRFYTRKGGAGPAAISDLDGDGREEVVFSAGDGHMYCLDLDGSLVWSLDIGGDGEYSAPVVAEFEGQPHILVGSLADVLRCVDANGHLLWTQRGTGAGGIEVGISLADLDGDGTDEIVFCHAGKSIQAVTHRGELIWSTYYGGGDQPFGPSVADLDGDGHPEILFAQRDGPKIRVLDRLGRLLEEHPVEGGMVGAPVVGDVDSDGLLEILVVEQKTGHLLCFSSKSSALPVPWPNSRGCFDGSGARVRIASRVGETRLRRTRPALEPKVDLAPRWFEGPHLGTNRVGFSGWHTSKNCWLAVALTDPQGIVHRSVLSAENEDAEFELLSPGECLLEAHLIDRSTRSVIGKGTWQCLVRSLGEDMDRVMELLYNLEPIECPDAELIKESRFSASEILKRIPLYSSMRNEDRRAMIRRVRELEARILRHTACMQIQERVRKKLGKRVRFFPWAPRHPWTEFRPGLEQPPGPVDKIDVLLDQGGHEARVLQLENLRGEEVLVRVWLEPPTSGSPEVPDASDLIQLREVAFVPTASGRMSGDALPELGNAGILHVPSSSSARLWIDIEGVDRPPGRYCSILKLRALVPQDEVWEIPIAITIAPTRLPKPMPIRFCNWGYVLSSPLREIADEAVRDMRDHHTNVFVLGGGTSPRATYDSKGRLVEVDWQRLDWLLDLLSDEDIILVPGNPLRPVDGAPGEFSRQWRKAFKGFLDVLRTHLSERGFGYKNWAFYPVDEPGLLGGLLTDRLERYARFYKELDPQVQVYTDPFKGMTVEDIRRVLDFVDIFQPNFGAVVCEPSGERIRYLKSTGKTLWTYEAAGHVKDMVGVTYYWRQIWTAWELGLSGVGFWSYCTRPYDLWQGPNPNGNEWELVYQGAEKPVPSTRWQAVRIALEDYARLWRLRRMAHQLRASGKRKEAERIEALVGSVVERARSSMWDPEVVSSLRRELIEASVDVEKQIGGTREKTQPIR